MRLLLLFFLLLWPMPLQAQTIKGELMALTQSVREAEKQSAKIDEELSQLRSEEQNILLSVRDDRYEAVKAYHALEVFKRSPSRYLYLLPDGSYQDYFFDLRRYETVKDVLLHKINLQTQKVLDLQDKQTRIQEYIRRRESLSLTLNAGLEQLKRLNTKREVPDEFRRMITDMKRESESLDIFLKSLLSLPEPLTENSTPLAFTLPVSGTIAQAPPGITIKAASSSLVSAPERGQVVFAGEFGHLGPVIIINHGSGYISVLKNLGEIFVAEGFTLQKGEAIGILPQKSRDKLGNNPMLYYELRYNHSIINPIEKITGL